MTKLLLFLLFNLLIVGGAQFMPAANGQTPSPTPDAVLAAAERDAALAKAKADKAEGEKREAVAENEKLKVTAQPFGTPSLTEPTGNVTTDATGFVETQILAQEAARVITLRFADEIKTINPKPENLIIYSASDITALASYMPVLLELRQFNSELETAHSEAVKKINSAELVVDNADLAPAMDPVTLAMAAPAIATGLVKSVAELTQLFRSTTDLKSKDVPVGEDTIVSYLANTMTGINIYYPSVFPARLASFADKTELSNEFAKIQTNKLTADDDVKLIESTLARLDEVAAKEKADLEKAKGKSSEETKIKRRLAKIDERRQLLQAIKSKIEFLIAAADQVIKGLETPDSTTKVTPLAQLVRSSHLQDLLNQDNAYTLRFNVEANGTTSIKQWLFFDAKIRHSAGARVAYQLFDKNGVITKANSFQFYFDWKSSKEVRACLDRPCK